MGISETADGSLRLKRRSGSVTTWRAVQAEILDRIRQRTYPPDSLIPTEHELAAELGCARATISRALGDLAARGVLERRRKVGTRVSPCMAAASTVTYPTLSQQIRAAGKTCAHKILRMEMLTPPPETRAELAIGNSEEALLTAGVMLADGKPWCFERRWTRKEIGTKMMEQSFQRSGTSDWLAANVPFTRIELWLTASSAADLGATEALAVTPVTPLLVRHSCSWSEATPITVVDHAYQAGHRLGASI